MEYEAVIPIMALLPALTMSTPTTIVLLICMGVLIWYRSFYSLALICFKMFE